MKRSRMDKWILAALVGIVVGSLLLAGCAAPAPAPAPAPSPTAAPSPAPSPSPAPAPTQGTVIKWQLANVLSATTTLSKYVEQFASEVKERTEGRLEIEVFHSASLIPLLQQFDAVSKGTIQANSNTGPYTAGVVPEAELEWIPFGYLNSDMFYTLFYEKGMLDIVREGYAKAGVYYVGPWPIEGFSTWSVKPVQTLADMKGFKIRSWGYFADLWTALGATPVSLPASETAMALKTGTLDGNNNGSSLVLADKLYESLKYSIKPDFLAVSTCNLLLNMDEWNKLPDDIKYIVETTQFEVMVKLRSFSAKEDILTQKYFESLGMKFVTLPDEDVAMAKEKMLPIWDKAAAKSPGIAKGIELLKQYLTDIDEL